MSRLGVALGSGGVRGLAQIPVLELLDELELRPSILAGTSMGALIGAIYASGMTGRSIRALVQPRVADRHGRSAAKEETTDVCPVSNPVPWPHSVVDFHQQPNRQ